MTTQLEQFKQLVLQNPALQEQFKSATNPQEFVNLAMQLGQEQGFSFTASELEAALSHSIPELSHEQLEAVTGGVGDKPYTSICTNMCI